MAPEASGEHLSDSGTSRGTKERDSAPAFRRVESNSTAVSKGACQVCERVPKRAGNSRSTCLNLATTRVLLAERYDCDARGDHDGIEPRPADRTGSPIKVPRGTAATCDRCPERGCGERGSTAIARP